MVQLFESFSVSSITMSFTSALLQLVSQIDFLDRFLANAFTTPRADGGTDGQSDCLEMKLYLNLFPSWSDRNRDRSRRDWH